MLRAIPQKPILIGDRQDLFVNGEVGGFVVRQNGNMQPEMGK
jgi:hypothetical protein